MHVWKDDRSCDGGFATADSDCSRCRRWHSPPIVTLHPPCISTGTLAGAEGSVFTCEIRNVGVTTHNVTGTIVNTFNVEIPPSLQGTVLPGQSVGFSTPNQSTSVQGSCVVTTDEGTPAALQDLAVTLTVSVFTADSQGQIFQQCALPTSPPP